MEQTRNRASPAAVEPRAGREPARAAAGEVALVAGLSLAGLALRLAGAAELEWASGESFDPPAALRDWLGATPLSARAPSLAAGAATVPIGWALARPFGRATAFALALLLATSPWHLHASRIAGPAAPVFLAALLAARWLGIGRAAATAPPPESRIGVVLAAGALLYFAAAPRPTGPVERLDLLFLATGSVGVAVPVLAALHFGRGARFGAAWTQLADAFVLACAGTLLAARWLGSGDAAAWLLPPVYLAAAAELGRWIAATRSRRAQLACAVLAVVPALPSMVSEHLDGGRADLEQIARAFARARRGGETLYASDPRLASRALGVEAQPLAELRSSAAPADRPAFVLLLLERGSALGAEGLPADFESSLRLVERSGGRRLDAQRFEARLYRNGPAP